MKYGRKISVFLSVFILRHHFYLTKRAWQHSLGTAILCEPEMYDIYIIIKQFGNILYVIKNLKPPM